jgi:hypothetical protein
MAHLHEARIGLIEKRYYTYLFNTMYMLEVLASIAHRLNTNISIKSLC